MGGMVSARTRGARIPHLSHFHHGGIRSAMGVRGQSSRPPEWSLTSPTSLLTPPHPPPSVPPILLPQSVPLPVLPARLHFQVFPPPSLDRLFSCSPAVHFISALNLFLSHFFLRFFLTFTVILHQRPNPDSYPLGVWNQKAKSSLIHCYLSHYPDVSTEPSAPCSIHYAPFPKPYPTHPPTLCNPTPYHINGWQPLRSLKPLHVGRWFISYEWRAQTKVHSCLNSERKQLAVWWVQVRCRCFTSTSYTGEYD